METAHARKLRCAVDAALADVIGTNSDAKTAADFWSDRFGADPAETLAALELAIAEETRAQ